MMHDILDYLMQEYPAELQQYEENKKEKPKFSYIFDILTCHNSSQNPNNNSNIQKYEVFFRRRINSITHTSRYYIILLSFLGIQILMLLLPFFSSFRIENSKLITDISTLSISSLGLKILGVVFCFGSWSAWKKQLWKNEEFYGLALGNYSKDEPINETLNMLQSTKERPERAIISTIVGDWLRNRPSLTFLLVACLTIINIHRVSVPLFSESIIYQDIMKNQLFFLIFPIIEVTLGLILFHCVCFPIQTDKKYIELRCKSEECRKIKNKVAHIRWGFYLVFLIIPVLLTTIVSFYWGQVLGYILLCFSGIGVWFIISVLFLKKKFFSTKIQSHRVNIWRIISVILYVGVPVLFQACTYENHEFATNWLDNNTVYDWPSVVILVILACFVYLTLFLISILQKQRSLENDRFLINSIQDIINNQIKKASSDDSVREIKEEVIRDFQDLSCSGQIKILNYFQALFSQNKHNILKISKLEDHAKTPQATDMIMELNILSLSIEETQNVSNRNENKRDAERHRNGSAGS